MNVSNAADDCVRFQEMQQESPHAYINLVADHNHK